MINFLKKYWFLIVIFILFAFFRFYNLDQRIIFDWDQEQFSYQASNILEKGNLTLIGPRVNNDRGFFLGPYFIYLLIPFYLIANLHPNALIIFIITYNIIFFSTSFWILNKIFKSKVALVFLSLWAINYQLLNFDTTAWNPILIPLGIMFVLFFLLNIYDNAKAKSYLLLGLTLGLFVNIHFQFLFIILFSLIFLLISFKKSKVFKIKYVLSLAASFFITFLPLFIFDLRNNFLNSKLFLGFFLEDNPALVNDNNVWKTVFVNFLKPFIYFEKVEYMWLFLFIILFMTLYLIKKNRSFLKNFYISFLIILIFTPIAFQFYGTRPTEYYFLYLAPFIIITIADFLILLNRKFLLVPLFVFLLALNNASLNKNLHFIPIGLFYKDKTIKILKNNIDETKKFNVTIDAPLGFHNGYKYLLDWYKIPQSGNFTDPLIQIKLPPEEVDIRVNDGIGLIIPKEVRK